MIYFGKNSRQLFVIFIIIIDGVDYEIIRTISKCRYGSCRNGSTDNVGNFTKFNKIGAYF